MSAIPPDFFLPEALLPAASELRGELRAGVYDLAERVADLGLPVDQANTVVVDWLVELACTLAMATAIADGRAPSRERWQEVTGIKFDRVQASFSPLISIVDLRQVL